MLLLSVVFAQDVVIDESLATGSSANEVVSGPARFGNAGLAVEDFAR